MVSVNGWLDGISAIGIVLFAIAYSLYILYRSKKLNLRVLAIAAFMILFVGLIYTAPTTDLLSLIFTDGNIAPELYGILAYVWVPPALICGIYIGAELLWPEKKTYILLTYIVLGIVFECFLFLDTANCFSPDMAPIPGSGDLTDSQLQLFSPAFILLAIFLLSVLCLNGLGFLFKARQQEGTIRKKFTLLSLTFIIFSILAVFDAFVPVGPLLVIVRLGIIGVTIILYYGLKPT